MTTKQGQLIKKIHELQLKTLLSSDIEEFSDFINSIMSNLYALQLLSVDEDGKTTSLTEYEKGLIQELKLLEQKIIENGLFHLKPNYTDMAMAINLLIIAVSGVGQSEIDELINRGNR